MTDRSNLGARVAGPVRSLGRLVRGAASRGPDDDLDARMGAALLAALAGFLLRGPLLALMAAAVVWARPAFRQRRLRAVRLRAIGSALPECVDLFRLAIGAGHSIHQVIDVVAPHLPALIAPTFVEVRRRSRLGMRLGDALDPLDDLGDSFRPLASALRSSAFDGVPLSASLERVAADARMVRRRHAEERARKLPVRLLFPLITCILPAFGLLTVVPLLVASMPSLSF
jgi:Flp pilus assembly protein TadB